MRKSVNSPSQKDLIRLNDCLSVYWDPFTILLEENIQSIQFNLVESSYENWFHVFINEICICWIVDGEDKQKTSVKLKLNNP